MHAFCYNRDHYFPESLAFADSQFFGDHEVSFVVDTIAAHFLVQCIVLNWLDTSCVGLGEVTAQIRQRLELFTASINLIRRRIVFETDLTHVV